MARFASVIVSFIAIFFACVASAAPLAPRQLLGGLGGIGCNVARIQTVGSLRRTIGEVNDLSEAAASDTATAAAASDASAALQSAHGGIQQIATALLTGQAPPQAGRDSVEQGFNAAKTALNSITSTDPAIVAQVAEAQEDLDRAIAAGQRVVDRC
ncbi:hypothetical protein FA15DRAFT_729205 [Coprinopsis marcescibilis]|uniref:Hydrophobic surface binding protein n=1 Tax=Coprinopsis marcescibilis TaxID=230819 RepID=A0A5C3KG63_COPMA|nr:hypothetical protein FA15DRAFT_729205 [Coprinopsis marcescibilis]